jgi:hypothetical protein
LLAGYKGNSGLVPDLIFCDIFEIEFIEMSKPAIPAPDCEMPAADGQVMEAVKMTVAAGGCLDQLPNIIAADLREGAFLTDIFNTGNKNPGRAAVVAGDLCLKGNSLDDLVGIFFAVITVSAVPREDKPVAHGR